MQAQSATASAQDSHSFAAPRQIRTTHLHLDLRVDFEKKALLGEATLELERLDPIETLALDTRDLSIEQVWTSADGESFSETAFELGEPVEYLGSPLRIELPEEAAYVRVRYATDPGASGLQWLTPEQTASKKFPFLFTQSQAIHARSWIPCQDTPGVRSTYSAVIHTPEGLQAVMSAERTAVDPAAGEYAFRMPQPIPSYLIALAVGEIAFQSIGDRAGVYAEPSIVARAAEEFEDIESMMQAAEALFGPYRWERYDILVLPPSFPFGGMENPRLTFATPTLLAGDKSLVNVIAHELAHSWSGNLVTNATWRDFWLNEGFTVYLENRIQEKVYSARRATMEAALEVQDLRQEMADLEPRDQILHVDLEGRDPDEGFTLVPYVKGMLFLRTVEEAVGRPQFDRFLRGYFDRFAFESITTADFLSYLREHLPEAAEKTALDQWIEEPGIPQQAALPQSNVLDQVDAARERWENGEISATELPAGDWTTQEWLRFLGNLDESVDAARLANLDEAFDLTAAPNAEIASRWLLESVKRNYEPAYPRLEEFLTTVGRRKFLKPLYEELAKTAAGKARAVAIYRQARPGYHPIAQTTVDDILNDSGE